MNHCNVCGIAIKGVNYCSFACTEKAIGVNETKPFSQLGNMTQAQITKQCQAWDDDDRSEDERNFYKNNH